MTAIPFFPSSFKQTKARTITRRPEFPGYNVLDAARSLTVDIQPSVAAFRSTFDRMSDGLLKNLNWNNIIVAGGIVLGVLLSVGGAAGEEWAASDIDIYIYGLTPAQANEKITELFATFKANLPKGSPVLIVRNSKTITFFSKYPLRRIQIVLKLVKSPRAVLLNFDLDICAMCWDGSEFWMLPRAARALETGYNVFTMNIIQGHYLSERRATQEQRVFKYADRGYGVRILPSYLSSLEESKSRLREISRGEILFGVDIDKIAAASRIFTQSVVDEYGGRSVGHAELENCGQLSSEPQGRSCLSGFSLFMRHVALWEMGQAGEIKIDTRNWASTNYEDRGHSILAYDDTPSYTWSESFTIPNFQSQIKHFNAQHIANWIQDRDHAATEFRETHGIGKKDGINLAEIFADAARLTCAQDMKTILSAKSDIVMPVVVPRNLAAYINHLVGEAQKAAKLKVQPILTPAVKDAEHIVVPLDSADSADGLYMWRIGKDIMWQQLDRRIDEVFEVLYAFYRANDRMINGYKEKRLITQLSKRAIRSTIDDEFEAFARWIGRQPIFVKYFFQARRYRLDGGTRRTKLYLVAPHDVSSWATVATHSLFHSVTHLELYRNENGQLGWREWSPLATLPALTHLCLTRFLSEAILQSALANCPGLTIAITAFWAEFVSTPEEALEWARTFAQGLTFTDPRIVVTVVLDHIDDWEKGARGGDDYWERADIFLQRKRMGEIESTCYLLPPDGLAS
ncbi:hypothetical protein MSAN_01621900 [Mycena sanguinolenta]|uniref:Uncharacterized protein n=1 Tax=Mycena sanguinolenta TaxID=230812 RepID=A0A8H6XZR7_9AGAR|nr:hypothetical protein MSAN_01621900 [Mycena sanguinolenta]